MTGELDSLIYENDFEDKKTIRKDITYNDKAKVKEMVLVNVDEKDIPNSVINMLEVK